MNYPGKGNNLCFLKKNYLLVVKLIDNCGPPSNSTIWKTYSGEVASSFTTPNTSIAGTLVLTF